MEQFIETAEGKINLRYITKMYERSVGGRMVPYAKDINGGNHQLFVEEAITDCVIIPATSPMTLIEIWFDHRDDDPFIVTRLPIVAWQIETSGDAIDSPIPIAVGASTRDSSRQFIELPDGKFQQANYEGSVLDSLDECKEWVKQADNKRHGRNQETASPGVQTREE